MGKYIKVDAKIDLPVLHISEDYNDEVDKACKQSAELGKAKSASKFFAQYQWLEPHKHAEHVAQGFDTMKAKYPTRDDPGWLFGVFGSDKQPWEESVGGRAHFFEYGRSAPGGGRGALHENASISRRLYKAVGGNDEAQPPRPFMRPARAAVSRKFNGITHKRLIRLARKLNTRIK